LYDRDVGPTTKKSDLIHSLAALGASVRWRDLAVAEIEELVALSRSQGATWEQIGERLGITRQSAHRIYGDDREKFLEERREAAHERAKVIRAAGLPVG
jgi:DNA-binding MarR family transcriptional regulator